MKYARHMFGKRFNTTGFDTEPAISFLRSTYPDYKWVDSGVAEDSFPALLSSVTCDMAGTT